MGLFGPAKASTRPSAKTVAKSGGAGNVPWYNSTVESATRSMRPASASANRSLGGGVVGGSSSSSSRPRSSSQYQIAQQQPTSHTSTAPYFATAGGPGVRNTGRPLSASSSSIPIAAEHEEDCICTVCTCGKHVCPPTPRVTHYPYNMQSENRSAYAGKFAPATRAAPPDRYKPHDVPFEGIATYKADYPDHGAFAPRRGPPRNAMMDTGVGRNSAPFDDTTTNKSDFPAHPLAKRNSAPPRADNLSTLGDDGRDFSTEGRAAFKPHPLAARSSAKPNDQIRPTLPFHGTSTNKSDFAPHLNARPAIPKFRSSGFQPAPEDRDFTTEGRSNFTQKQVAPCPAIPVAVSSKIKHGHVFVEFNPSTQTYRRMPF